MPGDLPRANFDRNVDFPPLCTLGGRSGPRAGHFRVSPYVDSPRQLRTAAGAAAPLLLAANLHAG
jgi:hypothetical protein